MKRQISRLDHHYGQCTGSEELKTIVMSRKGAIAWVKAGVINGALVIVPILATLVQDAQTSRGRLTDQGRS